MPLAPRPRGDGVRGRQQNRQAGEDGGRRVQLGGGGDLGADAADVGEGGLAGARALVAQEGAPHALLLEEEGVGFGGELGGAGVEGGQVLGPVEELAGRLGGAGGEDVGLDVVWRVDGRQG